MTDTPEHNPNSDLRAFAPSRETYDIEALATITIDAAYHLHRDLGPGLLESVYQAILPRILEKRGVRVERQVRVPITYQDMTCDDGFRVDLLVDRRLIVELKSQEKVAPVHIKQLLTYLRLLELPLGLLIHFGDETLKQGVKRVVNNHRDLRNSPLRVNRSE